MFEPITPVQAAPPTTGLVASAVTPSDGARWQNGMAWRPERCPQAAGFDPCGTTFESPVGSGGDDIVYYRPQAFRVTDECTTRDRTYDPERARRQALAVTSFMAARELEQGVLTRRAPYLSPVTEGDALGVNAFLQQAAGGQIVSGGPYTPLAGLGAVEEAARDAQLGQDVFIHVRPSLIPLLETALERNGSLLRTKTGAIVVADAGYNGLGPYTAGTSEVQTVTITGTPTGGTFTLTFQGQTTAPIAYNATAATVESRLEALSNLLSTDVAVSGGPGPGTPWVVTFAPHLGNVTQMTANGAGLTGGTTPAVGVVTTTPGVNPANTAGTWIYATGPVQVRLDPVEIVEPAVDWLTNRQTVIAERLFAATFDPCTLRAVAITVPQPA